MPNILEQISGLCDKQVHVRPTNESAVVQHQENCWQEPGSDCKRRMFSFLTMRSPFKRAEAVGVRPFRGERFFLSLLSCPATGWSNGRHQFVQEYDCISSGWKTCHLVLSGDRKQRCKLCH